MKSLSLVKRNQQQGFSIIDLMLWFTIFGGLIGMIVGIANMLMSRTEIQNASIQHAALVSGVQSMYGLDPTYTGISNTRVLVSQTAVPKKMRGADADSIKHTWSQDGVGVEIAAVNEGQSFAIAYTLVPADVCVEFVNSVREGAAEVSVNDVVVVEGNDVADNCLDTDDNAVAFTYN